MRPSRVAEYAKFYDLLILEGAPISQFMAKHQLPTTFYHFARKLGWTPAMRNKSWSQGAFPLHKRTLSDENVIRLHRSIDPETERPYTLAKIGLLAGGVSRQCIEQILTRHGLSAKKTPERVAWRQAQYEEEERERRERIEATRQLKEARFEEVQEKYRLAIEMWNSNKTMQEIAIQYNRSLNSMAWILFRLNEQYGWFPRRGVQERQGKFSKEAREAAKKKLEEEHSQARKMWAEGYTLIEIADAYKKTRDEMSWIIFKLNHKYGWFPRRGRA